MHVTKVHSKQKLLVDIDIKLGHVLLNLPQKCHKNCGYGEKPVTWLECSDTMQGEPANFRK